MKLHHIGIAVRDLDRALEQWELLGLAEHDRRIVEDFNVEVSMVDVGEVELEYIQPLGEGPIQNYLDNVGEGLHHVALEVPDIEARLQAMKDQGVRLVDETPRPGFRGNRVAFLHPKSLNGVLVELVEAPPTDNGSISE